jgi:alpha-glucosidase
MLDTDLPDDAIRDTMGKPGSLNYPGRDPARTPMQWSPEPGAGFTSPEATPWLPFGDYRSCNVAVQRDDPASVLNFCRDVIALRRKSRDLRRGAYGPLDAPSGLWAWRRGERTVVALNLSDDAARLDDVSGTIRISTTRARDGDGARAALELGPWEGLIVERD